MAQMTQIVERAADHMASVDDAHDPKTYAIIGAAIERAQIIHYIKITGMKTGLLLNFGSPKLEYERFKN